MVHIPNQISNDLCSAGCSRLDVMYRMSFTEY